MRRFTAILVLLPAVLSAYAASPATTPANADPHLHKVVMALEGRHDADSLAAAALLAFEPRSAATWELLTRAVTIAPGRADLVWLQLQSCARQPKCDSAAVARHLLSLDPGNGGAWLPMLVRAGAAHDDAAKLAALQAVGHSARVDIYWTGLVARLAAAVARTRETSLAEAELVVIGVLAAQAIPPYAAILNSCKGQWLSRAGMIATCRGAARSLQGGDTYITEMVGVALAQDVWPKDSSQWRAAGEARHVYQYRSRLCARIDGNRGPEAAARNYLALYESNHREQDVIRARLIEAGYAPDPPRQ